MNVLIIIVGALLIVTGVRRMTAPTPVAKEQEVKPVEPKSGDKRIVLRPDGRYVIERYSVYPDWNEIGRTEGWPTLERAKEVKAILDEPMPEKRVITD